jgi:hypothetical protein
MQVDTHPILGTGKGELQRIETQVQSEGLLLYLSRATYEPGTSPLSTWVPTQFEGVSVLDLFERCAYGDYYFLVPVLTEPFVLASCGGGCKWEFQVLVIMKWKWAPRGIGRFVSGQMKTTGSITFILPRGCRKCVPQLKN